MKTILVTRPSPTGEALCRLIEQSGDKAIHFPTIAFAPPKNLIALQEALAILDTQDWLIFISPQAVSASIPLIQRHWPHLPPNIQLAAVGLGTANALKNAGYLVAAYPTSNEGSEGLLQLQTFQKIAGKKITIARGEEGRDLLEKTLLARGATVSPLITYQRVLPNIDSRPIIDLFKQSHIDTVIGTSCDGVRHFKTLMSKEGWPFIQKVPLVVISERIKALAQDLGFQVVRVAKLENPSMS